MRDMECAPIAAQLEAMHAPSRRQTALFHRAERWRTDILADPGNVERFVGEHPAADAKRLRDLAAAAAAERRAQAEIGSRLAAWAASGSSARPRRWRRRAAKAIIAALSPE